MKRFAVLFSILALVSLYVASWATAPAIPDLPDVRLLKGAAPKGVISSGQILNEQEMDAYNLEEFIKDFDQGIDDLTISIPDVSWAEPPPSLDSDPTNLNPVPTIEIDGSNNVDVYGSTYTGWALYTVQVEDGTPAHTNTQTAIAKYSTFAMGTPSLTEGRFFDLTSDGWQLAYAWLGQDFEVSDLDVTIDPPTAVDWSVYMNDVTYSFDANGNLLGINPVYVAHGTSLNEYGWDVSIDTSGGLLVSVSEPYSPGPFLIGILATKQGTSDDMDATRIVLSAGKLGLKYPSESDPITHGKSETLDDLSTGPITSPTGVVAYSPGIRPGSHWMYSWASDDAECTPVTLDVVDLHGDGLLPPAADPWLMKGVVAAPAVQTIATGNGIRATFPQSSAYPTPAFRLVSRVMDGVEPGDVYTFAVNVATDIEEATNTPTVLMALANPLGAIASGFFLYQVALPGIPQLAGSILEQYHKDIIPFADDGWQTLSVNYAPPLTRTWLGYFASPYDVMNDDDITAVQAITSANEGWTDDLTAVRAALKMESRPDTTASFHVWLDNLRVYRSAYELDLAYAKTEYVVPATLSGYWNTSFVSVPQPTGNIDGTIESYTSTLDGIGFAVETWIGVSLAEVWRVIPYGTLPYGSGYLSVAPAQFTVNTSGVDHTKSNNSQNCLQIALPATGDAVNRCLRAQLDTAVVETPEGSGVYCVEMYVSKQRATNTLITDRTPAYKIALGQMAPNALGPAYGSFINQGALPESVGAETDNWLRLVGTGYIANAELIRAVIQVEETFSSNLSVESVAHFQVPTYFDDIHLYRVDDPAKFFDADLFDSI